MELARLALSEAQRIQDEECDCGRWGGTVNKNDCENCLAEEMLQFAMLVIHETIADEGEP